MQQTVGLWFWKFIFIEIVAVNSFLMGLKWVAAIAGIPGCRLADLVLLFLPVQMGYGAQKTGPIPANSWLEFDVSLMLALNLYLLL
jgi:hypothetical protein